LSARPSLSVPPVLCMTSTTLTMRVAGGTGPETWRDNSSVVPPPRSAEVTGPNCAEAKRPPGNPPTPLRAAANGWPWAFSQVTYSVASSLWLENPPSQPDRV
jgi:hypothetical protein